MNTYYLKPVISMPEEKQIYEAKNGQGYYENNELHLTDELHHYFYSFSGETVGWYMRNQSTNKDYYLGVGACPTLMLDECDVKDKSYWEDITYEPEVSDEPVEN